jgi:hypothetical protein
LNSILKPLLAHAPASASAVSGGRRRPAATGRMVVDPRAAVRRTARAGEDEDDERTRQIYVGHGWSLRFWSRAVFMPSRPAWPPWSHQPLTPRLREGEVSAPAATAFSPRPARTGHPGGTGAFGVVTRLDVALHRARLRAGSCCLYVLQPRQRRGVSCAWAPSGSVRLCSIDSFNRKPFRLRLTRSPFSRAAAHARSGPA